MSWLFGANAGTKEGANLYTGNLHLHQLKSVAELQCSEDPADEFWNIFLCYSRKTFNLPTYYDFIINKEESK